MAETPKDPGAGAEIISLDEARARRQAAGNPKPSKDQHRITVSLKSGRVVIRIHWLGAEIRMASKEAATLAAVLRQYALCASAAESVAHLAKAPVWKVPVPEAGQTWSRGYTANRGAKAGVLAASQKTVAEVLAVDDDLVRIRYTRSGVVRRIPLVIFRCYWRLVPV